MPLRSRMARPGDSSSARYVRLAPSDPDDSRVMRGQTDGDRRGYGSSTATEIWTRVVEILRTGWMKRTDACRGKVAPTADPRGTSDRDLHRRDIEIPIPCDRWIERNTGDLQGRTLPRGQPEIGVRNHHVNEIHTTLPHDTPYRVLQLRCEGPGETDVEDEDGAHPVRLDARSRRDLRRSRFMGFEEDVERLEIAPRRPFPSLGVLPPSLACALALDGAPVPFARLVPRAAAFRTASVSIHWVRSSRRVSVVRLQDRASSPFERTDPRRVQSISLDARTSHQLLPHRRCTVCDRRIVPKLEKKLPIRHPTRLPPLSWVWVVFG